MPGSSSPRRVAAAPRNAAPPGDDVHRFAFVIHPLSLADFQRHPALRWTRHLPDGVMERLAARMPPTFLSRITGGVSPATGQRIEGLLYSLGATPRQMMSRPERFTYDRVLAVARKAQRQGARILGLGAFTSVVGDAGETLARQAPIAITSGNSLTVSATLDACKIALRGMGHTDLAHGRAMVIGATGSIGAACARLLAQASRDVVLVSIEPERLRELAALIAAESPGCRVETALTAPELAPTCDLVVTATSAFGQRVLDVSRLAPGAVVCDVARPSDVTREEAALRPDVLVIEGGEVLIPGDVDFGFDIGLPPKVSYACLAETALLAMAGRFESFTIGRRLDVGRVKEIYRLSLAHGFQIAALRSFGELVGDEELAARRHRAAELARDPARLADVREEAARHLATLPPRSKGISAGNGSAPAAGRPASGRRPAPSRGT